MERIDAKLVKDRIMKFMDERGPGLPVQIAKAVGLNTIFTSAFLSEAASEGLIKISSMKVGGSPLYYTKVKEAMLENFFQYLNQKEQEAVKLLKEKSFLLDSEQHPAIRVALRGLKDFAFPINKNGIIIWRYFLINEAELDKISADLIKNNESQVTPITQSNNPVENISKTEPQVIKEEIKIEINSEPIKNQEIKEETPDFNKMKIELEEKKMEIEKLREEILIKNEKKPLKEIKLPGHKPGKPIKAKDETFLNSIKEILIKKSQEIISIEEFDKKYAIIRVKDKGRELLIAAFDKKKLEDSDLLGIAKKASLLNLGYSLIFRGELSKKTKEIIEAYKRLDSAEKIE